MYCNDRGCLLQCGVTRSNDFLTIPFVSVGRSVPSWVIVGVWREVVLSTSDTALVYAVVHLYSGRIE
jgi:hypothetical protein